MRVTSKGQVTIPVHIREKYGLLPDTEIEWVEEEAGVYVRRAARQEKSRGQRIVERIAGTGTPYLGMSTDEMMEFLRGPYDDPD